MTKYLTILSVIFLAGCSTNCFEKASIAKSTMPVAYKATADALENGFISKGAAIEALTVIDTAQATVDKGAALCVIDEPAALDYIESANDALKDAIRIAKENKEL